MPVKLHYMVVKSGFLEKATEMLKGSDIKITKTQKILGAALGIIP